ncbi:hypothetical protein CgunFtcFv8_016824 [Champsocephalus gunnari]|uniref:Uncharacterized protein n=1 Tax=Champsocephalus gunnari TaxID=52237 RepID=A0AAN8HB92_CHAGU|nr:hypothetical protein CgunFtcFv8_016824 [Champsocephalus gunnari]
MHAINKVIAPPTVSSQTHPSQGNWIRGGGLHFGSARTDPPAQRSISSRRTLTGLQSGNTIHDKLFSNSSWTGSNTFPKPKGITSAPMR